MLSHSVLPPLRRLIPNPDAIILFIGPAGSAKITTLNAALPKINQPVLNSSILKAARTGPVDASSLPANHTPRAIARLLEIGEDSCMVAPSVVSALAQRLTALIRKRCQAAPFSPPISSAVLRCGAPKKTCCPAPPPSTSSRPAISRP